MRAYWRQKLGGLTLLQLPTDRPRPIMVTSNGKMQWTALPSHFIFSIKALSQQEQVTSFVIALAAFEVLLYRYARQTDIVVGTPVANRDQPELEGLIGFFVDTIILRTDLSGNPTFRELLQRVRQVILEAQLHKDLPVEHIIAEIRAKRDASRNPLCQVLFTWQDWQQMHQGRSIFCGLESEGMGRTPTDTAKFDLTLSMERLGEAIVCAWEYNTDLFDEDTIVRMSKHLEMLLGAASSNPDQRIGELALLSDEERRQVLEEWNATQEDRPARPCLPELFEAQAHATPEAVAVVWGEQALTYGELDRRAEQLAQVLRGLGIGPEAVVGLCVERRPELIVGVLGVLKAGGAYVPLDPQYPAERLRYILQDTQARVVLTERRVQERLAGYAGQRVYLDAGWAAAARPAAEGGRRAWLDNAAYVIYTSGSTGQPKGVTVQHRSLGGICGHGATAV